DGREVYVLADEVYRELHFGAAAPASIARYHASTLIAGSLSKSSALTGLRLGWLAGPPEVIAAATKVHQFVNTAATTFAQRVALAAFQVPGRISAHRDVYSAVRTRLLATAEDHELDLIPPEGSFYAFVRLPAHLAGDSVGATERLLRERRVVAIPGRAFG